jgi:hypothetical protein
MKTRLVSWLVAGLCMSLLTACSRTVTWEEEVLLNTGETIWVKRTAKYSYQGGAGNPFDMAYRPDGTPTLQFTYKKRKYYFHEPIGVMVLAISPEGVPILVAPASSGRWDAVNKYKCTYPFYVQFVPDQSGKRWSWPPAIEPWLYSLPTNLFRDYGNYRKVRSRYTMKEKELQPFFQDPQLKHSQRIYPDFTGDICSRKEEFK